MSGYTLPNYNDEQAAIIKQMYLAKRPAHEIAKAVSSNITYISRHVTIQEYYKGNLKAKKPDIIRKRAKSLHDKGFNYCHIAVKLKISRATVQRIAKDDGWYENRGPRTKITIKMANKIRLLYQEGMTCRAIAKEFKCGRGVIEKYVQSKSWHRPKELALSIANSGDKQHRVKARLAFLKEHSMTYAQYWGYRRYVRVLSEYMYSSYIKLIDPDKNRGNEYHVDHVYCINQGLKSHTDPLMVAHPANLRMLSAFDNISKHIKTVWTETQLKKQIKKFEAKHGRVLFPSHLLDVNNQTWEGIENYAKVNRLQHKHVSRKLRIRKIPRT